MRNPSQQMLLAGVLSALPFTTVFADEPHACESDKGTTTIRLDLGRKINVSCEAPVGDGVRLEIKGAQPDDQCSIEVKRASATVLSMPAIPQLADTKATIAADAGYKPAECQSAQKLGEGDTIQFTLTRNTGQSWVASASVPAAGEWRSFFGVATLPNFDRNYYSRPDGAGGYTITRAPDTGGVSLAAAAFFKYHMFHDRRPWQPGLLAGLGLGANDSATLIPFLGLAWEYRSSLVVSLGVTYEQQKRLKPEYQVGQTVTENLSNDALTQDVMRANAFVGIAYYFGSSGND